MSVTLDGTALVERLGGDAIAVDPGVHTLVFTLAGEPPITRQLVLKEGEKGRIEKVSFARATRAEAAAAHQGLGAQAIAGIALGAAGIVGLGLGAGFGLSALDAKNTQEEHCPSETHCPERALALEDHDTAQSHGLGSTIAFVAGGVMLATGVVVFFTADLGSNKSSQVSVVPVVGPSNAGLRLTVEL